MSQMTVKERVSALELAVAEFAKLRPPAGRVKDWRRTVGMFSGNKLMKEIDEAGQKLREQDRQRKRRRATQRRRTLK